MGGYLYESSACLICHPTGEKNNAFNHDNTTFPLTGAHIGESCVSCHSNGYKGTPTACVECHKDDHVSSLNPSHQKLNIGTDCQRCHSTSPGWSPAAFPDHYLYYTLNGAHTKIANDCYGCHQGNYNQNAVSCYTCHKDDFDGTQQPVHSWFQFSTDCASCHFETSWTPSSFNHDGLYFPVYSGKHKGTWQSCTECHTSPTNPSEFSCIACHTNPETDDAHTAVNGYSYHNSACIACHPTGDADDVFDHNNTQFPLTGAHIDLTCIECHSTGFTGTPTACNACHQTDYNEASNPSHIDHQLSTECNSCHSTVPGWSPASFEIHDNYYVLRGAHAAIKQNCASCHNGDYNNTPNTCTACHQSDYNTTTDPNHIQLQFPVTCASCHSENSWSPSTYDHDNQFFPIYSGKHQGAWTQCLDCHTNPSDYTQFTCINCHINPETDQLHFGVNAYSYDNQMCLACHPTGDVINLFDHNSTAFALTGAHFTTQCIQCHASGFSGTPTECISCHSTSYIQSVNPNHTSLNLSTDCTVCHTTAAGWAPAAMPNHNDYYVLEGAHSNIANQCVTCHQGDYTNTPNTCVACHQQEYNNTTNPDHQTLQYPTNCIICHSQSAWSPVIFDHNAFYPLTGAHANIANQCDACHNGNYSNTPTTCVGCHQSNYDDATNPNHTSL
ncbi:MAG: hypothetical protein LW630_12870, partial [Saprospiraceae bacterium]|nr:hypothetical protein [Saprospiraceae bacterium]